MILDEVKVVVVGHEADFLALRLVVDRQVLVPGDRPDLGLGEFADREQHPVKQLGGEPEEDVGLILRSIESPRDPVRSVGRSGDPGVMAGGDEIGPHLLAVFPEPAELEPDVAHHAGVGRAAVEVFVGEIILDPPELALEVEHEERQVEAVGDALGVDGVGDAATGLGAALFALGVGAGAHEQTDHVVSARFEQIRGHGAVDSAAHRQDDTLGFGQGARSVEKG